MHINTLTKELLIVNSKRNEEKEIEERDDEGRKKNDFGMRAMKKGARSISRQSELSTVDQASHEGGLGPNFGRPSSTLNDYYSCGTSTDTDASAGASPKDMLSPSGHTQEVRKQEQETGNRSARREVESNANANVAEITIGSTPKKRLLTGNIGHPDECTPCRFFCYSFDMTCNKGNNCEYCHMEHTSNRMERKMIARKMYGKKKAFIHFV